MTKKPTVSNPQIYCIGDSHASFFAGADRIQPNWPTVADGYLPLFKVLKIGSSLAYSLSVEGSRTRGREQLFEVLETSVPQGAHVMLIFGEIDCRAHVLKQAARRSVPVSVVVEELAQNYFSVVEEVVALGYEVIVYNAIPSRIKAPTKSRQDPDYIAIGSCLERNAAAKLFNQRLAEHCSEKGIRFLDIFDALVHRNGITNTWYYFDTIHLSQRAMPIVLNRLPEILSELELPKQKVLVPSPYRRLADRLCKRIRRLLKIKPPLRAHRHSF